jgi:hypothetical protein
MAVTPVTNNVSAEWAINDEVVRVREWGTDRSYSLFADDRSSRTIGTAPGSWIRIRDSKRRVSRQHAHLERVRGRWCIFDDNSTNGVFVDGTRRDQSALVPCLEIGLGGGATLIAESPRSIALRQGLARMLGWAPEQAEAVDLALRGARLAATRRSFLVLCGDQELVPLAAELHRLTLTNERPFVLCNPLRRTAETPETPYRCVTTGLAALAEAPDGTVCLYHRHLPPDLLQLMRDLRIPECLTQLAICAPNERDALIFNPAPIVVPSLSTRSTEIDRLIETYTDDAANELELRRFRLSVGAHAWIRGRSAETLADIQRATLRLAAVHKAGTMTAAAPLLKLSHTGMIKWFRLREYPRDLRPGHPADEEDPADGPPKAE